MNRSKHRLRRRVKIQPKNGQRPTRTPRIAASYAQCTWPIFDCLQEAEQTLGFDGNWQAINSAQAVFLNEHYIPNRDVRLECVESKASFIADEIEDWFAERNRQVQIESYDPNQFGLASIFDLLLEWPEDFAERCIINVSGERSYENYDGVLIERCMDFFSVPNHEHPIVEVRTKDERTKVYMTILDELLIGEFALVDSAHFLSANKSRAELYHPGVKFPMIHLEETTKPDWIIGMWATNTKGNGLPALITELVQKNRLRMNEKGVRAESEVYISGRLMGRDEPRPYEIDEPFLLWIERDGVVEPLYAAWLDHDSWKDPGGLG